MSVLLSASDSISQFYSDAKCISISNRYSAQRFTMGPLVIRAYPSRVQDFTVKMYLLPSSSSGKGSMESILTTLLGFCSDYFQSIYILEEVSTEAVINSTVQKEDRIFSESSSPYYFTLKPYGPLLPNQSYIRLILLKQNLSFRFRTGLCMFNTSSIFSRGNDVLLFRMLWS